MASIERDNPALKDVLPRDEGSIQRSPGEHPRDTLMTVSEMIDVLKGYPGDLRVVVDGYEDGYDDPSPRQISNVRIALNAGTQEWIGKHLDHRDLPAGAEQRATVVDALVLRRLSH